MLCEMQSVSSRIWTCVAVSYDDNFSGKEILLLFGWEGKFFVVVSYIKVRSFKMSKSKCVFKNSFYLQHGKCSLRLCCKSHRKVVIKETKWSYEKVEKAVRIVRRARDCVWCSLAKVLFAVWENKLWSLLEFCVSGDLGRGVCCLH